MIANARKGQYVTDNFDGSQSLYQNWYAVVQYVPSKGITIVSRLYTRLGYCLKCESNLKVKNPEIKYWIEPGYTKLA